MKILAVIPSRFASTRLPGKPLILINNKPLVMHVYDGIKDSPKITKTIVATDDKMIFDTVINNGGEAILTSSEHATGTDRIIEVLDKHSNYDIILNIQGDEPLVNHATIDLLCEPFSDPNISMTTLKREIQSQEDIENTNTVKVVTDLTGKALYFSRYPIPFNRDKNIKNTYYRHIGLYGFRKELLLKIKDMPQSPLEISESLEQLRVLENGYNIQVNTSNAPSVDVNTEEDISLAEEMLNTRT